ncbi:MAG: hypothetical protein KDC82_08520, partial [Bacteroidetes bacterium]|nr:hypothetical protein [Bacteroidota bacterium]
MSRVSHTKIIWDAMSVMVTDDHPVIYQYIKGKVRSRETAIGRLTGLVAPIFIGAYDVSKIRSVSRKFLEQKEKDYKAGKVKI